MIRKFTTRWQLGATLVLSAAAFVRLDGAPQIPLCAGLTIVTAISQSTGDYESIKTAKTTAIGVSAAVLKALKTRGESDFAISAIYPGSRLTGDPTVSPNAYDFLQLFSIKSTNPTPIMVPVLLNNTPVELPAIRAFGESGGVGGDQNEFFILDDERNPLMLKFRLGIGGVPPLTKEELEYQCEPLKKSGRRLESSLSMGINCALPNGGDRDTLRVVKIETRCGGGVQTPPTGSGTTGASAGSGEAPTGSGAGQLEQQLTEKRRAEVYSIYFSFNSDAIREESEPTLKDIAAV